MSLKEYLAGMPHVNTVWLSASGEIFIHPQSGCEKLTREQVMGESPEEEPKRKKK